MFLYLGEDTVITDKNIIGIFDMDTSTVNKATRDYLNKAQKDGREIKLAAIKYADDLLERVETDVKSVNEKIKQCREGLRQ